MATPLFCCGYECGLIAGVPGHWANWFGNTPQNETTIVRSGTRSAKYDSANNTMSYHITPAIFGGNRHIGRFYVYIPTTDGGGCSIAHFGDRSLDAAGPCVRHVGEAIFASISDGVETFTNGATGVTVTRNEWHRIDYDFNVNTGGNDTCDVKVNGIACGQATATGTSTGSNVDSIGVTNAVLGRIIYVDDYVCSATAADYPIGSGYVHHFVPTSDGTHNIAGAGDFRRTLTGTDILNTTTTAFQLVDDIPLDVGAGTDWINMVAPPNATDYVECKFGPAPGIPTPGWGPRSVEVIAGIHQAGTGTGNMEIRMNDNGTTDAMYTATAVAGVTTIAYKRKQYATAIAGGGAWGVAAGNGNFNDLRVRFGSPAAVDANPDQYFDSIMVEAEFVSKSLMPEAYVAPRFYIQKKVR